MKTQSLIWPNFFIVGSIKSGTTTVYNQLKRHPDVFLPRVKEPNYFSQFSSSVTPSLVIQDTKDLRTYQRLYRRSGGYKAVGDASPFYLYNCGTPASIHSVAPHAKIVIILRDPVVRAYSHFLMDITRGILKPHLSFLDIVKAYQFNRNVDDRYTPYIDLGLYHAQVERYINTFGRDRVKVLLFDSLKRDPTGMFHELALHLGIDSEPFKSMNLTRIHNGYRAPRLSLAHRLAISPPVSKVAQTVVPIPVRSWLFNSVLLADARPPQICEQSGQFLQHLYAPDISRLEELLDRPLPELRGSWR